MEPDTDHLFGSARTTQHMKCWRKQESIKMVTGTFWTDGIKMTNTASLCQILGGLEERTIQYDETALEEHSSYMTRKKSERANPGTFLCLQKVFKGHWISAVTLKTRSECKRLHEEHTAIIGDVPSWASIQTKAWSTTQTGKSVVVKHQCGSDQGGHEDVVVRLDSLRLSTLHSSFNSPIFYFNPPDLSLHLPCGSVRRQIPCAFPRMRSPNFYRWLPLLRDHWNFHPESSNDTRPSYSHDSEIDDCTVGRALSSPLFTQEREEQAGRGQACLLMKKVCCQLNHFSHAQVRGDPYANLRSLTLWSTTHSLTITCERVFSAKGARFLSWRSASG